MRFRAYIVEDSPTIRQNLTETLQELAQVEAVGSAETESEGARWLSQNPDAWDLAIVDLFLKEGTGLHVLEACRFRQPTQKMVVLSNHATQDVRWRCAQLGADAVFDKSTEIDDLLAYCQMERERLEHMRH
jgi:DNA-binding NarL/FixJ family response regulator